MKTLRPVLFGILFFTFSLPALANRFEELRDRETEIDQLAAQSIDSDCSADHFYENVILKKGAIQDDGSLEAYLTQWSEAASRFHTQRLQLVLDKQEYFLNYVQFSIEGLAKDELRTLNESAWWWKLISWRQWSRIESGLKNAEALLSKWRETKHTLVSKTAIQEERRTRVYAFRDYFREVSQLLTTLGRPPLLAKSFSTPKLEAARILGGVILQNCFPNCFPQKPNTTPLTHEISSVMKYWAQREGVQVETRGKHYLEELVLDFRPSDEKRINLFLPAHRSTVPDSMAMANLRSAPLPRVCKPGQCSRKVPFKPTRGESGLYRGRSVERLGGT